MVPVSLTAQNSIEIVCFFLNILACKKNHKGI